MFQYELKRKLFFLFFFLSIMITSGCFKKTLSNNISNNDILLNNNIIYGFGNYSGDNIDKLSTIPKEKTRLWEVFDKIDFYFENNHIPSSDFILSFIGVNFKNLFDFEDIYDESINLFNQVDDALKDDCEIMLLFTSINYTKKSFYLFLSGEELIVKYIEIDSYFKINTLDNYILSCETPTHRVREILDCVIIYANNMFKKDDELNKFINVTAYGYFLGIQLYYLWKVDVINDENISLPYYLFQNNGSFLWFIEFSNVINMSILHPPNELMFGRFNHFLVDAFSKSVINSYPSLHTSDDYISKCKIILDFPRKFPCLPRRIQILKK